LTPYLCPMSDLHIYNSLTRKKEKFVPLHPPFVGMYVCGPTVYNEVHMGNVRTFLTFDTIYRYLVFLGYKVRYVRNITDVGHLVNDADEGEDKIARMARLEQMEPMEIVQKYTIAFHDVMRMFNLLNPSIEPTATGHIIEQVEMIKRILDNGFAYVVNGSVYFDVLKYNEQHKYGQLSGRVLEDLLETTRELDGQEEKRNKADFALWKNAGEEHIMRWPSPWGMGFPGWHLECSAMSTKYLGQTFDIHGGGMDLKFPHHECEIAQSVGADGKAPVRYWMHSNMLNFDGKKMSKSEGNFILPLQMVMGDHPLLDKGYSPMTIRFLMLQSHYSSELDISVKALQDAEKGYKRIMDALGLLPQLSFAAGHVEADREKEIAGLCGACKEGMDDDFNTAKTIASLYGLASQINSWFHAGKTATGISKETFDILQATFPAYIGQVLGLQGESAGDSNAMDSVMQVLIHIRNDVRAAKNWAVSDQIRDRLKEAGIVLKDNKDGTTTYEMVK
jgi:cysteinyl-tRNA synthetase